jgi:2-methylisocitrate lyase-like PEP mutase family enzyme
MAILRSASQPTSRLRTLLDAGGPVLAAGAYDALSARLIEAAGFDAVYLTGFGAAASLLGQPDVGLLTQTEMVDHAARLAGAVDVPLIADADTGYGNPLNVIRTVQLYERAGVAALHLEDQAAPKKCGHLAGKVLVPAAEHEARIRAAVAARTDPDLVIIARTDARAVEGLDAALERARRYAGAGADVLFVEAPQSRAEIERIAASLAGHRLLFNWVEGGRTPPVSLAQLAERGYRLVIYPVSALLAASRAVRTVVASIRETGTPEAAVAGGHLDAFGEFVRFIGLDEVEELESRFLDDPPQR